MKQVSHHVATRFDDEVLNFWAAQARQQQEAQEAIRRYLCARTAQAASRPGSDAWNNHEPLEEHD